MTPTTPLKARSAPTPASPLAPEPPAEAEVLFPPSAELGDQLEHLADAQAALDRRKAEELARLRELQSQD